MDEDRYSWNNVKHGTASNLPKTEGFWKWVSIALLLAIVSHGIVMFALGKVPIVFDDSVPESLETSQVIARNVEDRELTPEARDIPDTPEVNPDAIPLLEEIDETEMLENLTETMELDINPNVNDPEFNIAPEIPPLAGDPDSSNVELTEGTIIEAADIDPGVTNEFLKPKEGQVVIDAGTQLADKFDPDKYTAELAKGIEGGADDGQIEGYTSLNAMKHLKGNALENAKSMIGSDLLYAFNKATLRDSAKNSLMKVVQIIDNNPNMHCWIEGHSDLIGGDEPNRILSIARAMAVKNWLVNSVGLDADKLHVRGFGKSQPIVLEGDKDAQAINRRVEIKMRSKAPPALIVEPNTEPPITPGVAIPVEEPTPAEPLPPTPEDPPRALPVEPEVPKAIPVE